MNNSHPNRRDLRQRMIEDMNVRGFSAKEGVRKNV
jgi:hypothetical protein